MEGLITKLVAGVYTVEAGGCILECKAKGTFRKLGISPLVGDLAQVSLRETGDHSIDSLLPRRNSLCRPPLANLDQLFIVVSAAEPAPNFQVIDRMTAAADDQEITPVLVITKTDLAPYEEIVRLYTHAGFDVVITSAASGKGVMEVKKRLAGKISAFAGNTGVGKSTLLNRLDPVLALQTGEISPKLGRGRHTTRHVELYALRCGARVMDTPGFSSFDVSEGTLEWKEHLPETFPEFRPYLGQCRFVGCSHTKEKGCAVLRAVKDGIIPKSRHDSYLRLFQELKHVKAWEQRSPRAAAEKTSSGK